MSPITSTCLDVMLVTVMVLFVIGSITTTFLILRAMIQDFWK